MPSSRIVTGDWAFGREGVLIDAVQAALTAALGVPDWNRDIVVDAYDAAHRAVPTGQSERFTRIEIALPPVGSLDAKRALYTALVEELERAGVPPLETKIVLYEVPAENWGLRGGVPGLD
jgi:phenylpyruvate tautomerase PptA (4-oxalocrotonate tautomerase family)